MTKRFFNLVGHFAILFTLIILTSITAHADGFDAEYYAARYPDVVNELGTDPAALYNHYLTFGIAEGRYQNMQEETADIGYSQIPVQTPAPQAQEIIPVYSTYIDVDIAAQQLVYYEEGQAKLSTPCVSGNPNTGCATPTGTFAVQSKVQGKFLTGATWNVWVDYWMQFTDSKCGFHDASWRDSFGGDIYQANGSHGCVNLPKDAAVALFNMINVGTIVIVH